MFRSILTRIGARCAAAIDDLLAADFDLEDDAVDPLVYHREHPHRAPLRSARPRRPGRVAAAPAHCVSPVRPCRGAAKLTI